MLTFAAEAILSTKHKNYITRATYQQTNKKNQSIVNALMSQTLQLF